MNKPDPDTNLLIAPCGMNCGICWGFLREKNTCPGCRMQGPEKPGYCRSCIIANCEKTGGGFCYECAVYPCRRLKQLDKRYRARYRMSMLENLENISLLGLDQFVKNEKERWRCPACGETICVHRPVCSNCGTKFWGEGETGQQAQ